MTAAPFFHIGILVNDINEARVRFGDAFKITWTDVALVTTDDWEIDRGNGILNDLKISYSQEGPFHIELIEAQGNGLYNPAQGEGFHHLGLWESDPKGRTKELAAMGLNPIETQYTPQREILVSYFDPEKLFGIVLELVDQGRRPMMESWFNGGPFVA
jgi:hypothetical protein